MLKLPCWSDRNPPIKVSKVVFFPLPDGPVRITISPASIVEVNIQQHRLAELPFAVGVINVFE